MKLTRIIILFLGLQSCINSTEKNSVELKVNKDKLTQKDQNEVKSKKHKEFDRCNFDQFVNDPKTPKLAVAIYLDKEWDLSNDDEALALLDSLTAKNKTSRPFYFKVITKSEKKSDGYFTEGLAFAGYNYVLNNTAEFASYFIYNTCHTSKDLAIWADIIMMEMNINGEGNDYKSLVEDYINKLKSNCKNCTPDQKEIINTVGFLLKEG